MEPCCSDLRRNRDRRDGWHVHQRHDKSFISFAEGTILVVAIAVFASLTILPAMLSWLGDRVEKVRSCSAPTASRRIAFWTAASA